jgi:hypothetical protein
LRYPIIILSSVLLILACSEKATEPEDILVLSDSFERLGNATHVGWQIDPGLTDFSGDTPTEGNNIWSLKLLPGNTSEGFATKLLDVEHGDGIYSFSVWARMSSGQPAETGYIRYGVMHDGTVTQSTTFNLDDTLWAEYSVTDTLTFEAGDRIYIHLSCGSSAEPVEWYSLFDLVRIEKLVE